MFDINCTGNMYCVNNVFLSVAAMDGTSGAEKAKFKNKVASWVFKNTSHFYTPFEYKEPTEDNESSPLYTFQKALKKEQGVCEAVGDDGEKKEAAKKKVNEAKDALEKAKENHKKEMKLEHEKKNNEVILNLTMDNVVQIYGTQGKVGDDTKYTKFFKAFSL